MLVKLEKLLSVKSR